MTLLEQLGWLALLAMPVACIAWTITHEELFREAREWCAHRSRKSRTLLRRKRNIRHWEKGEPLEGVGDWD